MAKSNDSVLLKIKRAIEKRTTTLNLAHKRLDSLPPEIAYATHLKQLYLRGNNFTTIPPEIFQLTALEELSFRENKLSEIPREIGKLTKLSMLSLSKNNLTTLPSEIGELKNLTRLSLSNNQLVELPSEIGLLTNLTYLSLNNNQLSSFPTQMGQLVNLTQLRFENNLFPSLPPEIAKRAAVEKINYYLQHQSAAELKPLNEAKMLLVGQGGVGKTSLVRRLLTDTFDLYENKTEGINIERWEIKLDGQKINVNIWDFGGQEIMHSTHQFFLTKRSLYLLVIDARQGDNQSRLEYWLKLIQSFGGEAPIIVVNNKCDQQLPDIDRRGLQKKYPTIKGFVTTSCSTGQGIEELRESIIQELGQLPHIYDKLPISWFNIKIQMESLEADYIPYKQYRTMCIDQGIIDQQSQRTLIGFLHDLGVVLNFRDDLRLQETNILNPDWVTIGVYKILNSNVLFQSKGVLDRAMLTEILIGPGYPPDKHLFIIDMMRRFELCFDFEGFVDQKFLIPDLLSKEEPYTGEWLPTKCLGLQYHYNILPNSVMSRFIVRSHPYIYKNTYWRNGVVLANDSNKALVKADPEERQIVIYVTGRQKSRREFLAVIRAQFEYIHRTISKLEVQERVPVPRKPEVTVSYGHLLKLEEKGISTYLPEGLDDEINVRQLLDGIEIPVSERAPILDTPDFEMTDEQIVNLTRRLQKLREYQALKGIDTEPHYLVEIENIEERLEDIFENKN